MRELLPGASRKAIQDLIEYAEELDERGTHPKGAYFSECYVNFNLSVRDHGADITSAVLKVCEESCLNPWEIRDAARLMAEGASPEEILQKSDDGELDYLPDYWSELETGLAELQNGTLAVPAADGNLSPAQMALNEPGIFDEDIDCVETSTYMSMLIDRVNANFIEYIDGLRDMGGSDITNYTSEIARVSEAHYYITERFNFHFSELDYLLKFKNPLMVVVEEFDANIDKEHSVVMWNIFHEQDALKKGRHALAFDSSDNPGEPGLPTAEALKQELFDRLDKNLSDYRNTMMSNSKQFIYDMAEDIAVKFAAREYMKTGYDYKTGEVEFLLQFQNPLALVVDNWPSTLDGLTDMTAVISGIFGDESSHGHYALVTDETNPAAKESTKAQPGAEKQSVIERIRAAEKEPKQPHKEKTQRDKSETEL